MKKYLLLGLVGVALLASPMVHAQTVSPQDKLNDALKQVIALLTQQLEGLQAQLNALLAAQASSTISNINIPLNVVTSTPIIININPTGIGTPDLGSTAGPSTSNSTGTNNGNTVNNMPESQYRIWIINRGMAVDFDTSRVYKTGEPVSVGAVILMGSDPKPISNVKMIITTDDPTQDFVFPNGSAQSLGNQYKGSFGAYSWNSASGVPSQYALPRYIPKTDGQHTITFTAPTLNITQSVTLTSASQ